MKRKIRYGNSVETMIADQKFKISRSNTVVEEFFRDCIGNINSNNKKPFRGKSFNL